VPKINVYLSDELDQAVKKANLPVSAICQRALEQTLSRLASVRETTLSDVDCDEPGGIAEHFALRTREALRLARNQAHAEGAPTARTEHLLWGLLSEGNNLALHILLAMDIQPESVRNDLIRMRPSVIGDKDEDSEKNTPQRLDGAATSVLELAVTEAASLGHNYVGCEHLLLGLVAEPGGLAGQVLRKRGVEPHLTRRAVLAASAGYIYLQTKNQNSGGSLDPQAITEIVQRELEPVLHRLELLESNLGLS
jgi:ATP-dependent Clp protease ATP-binding subunit ClpC